MNALLREFGKSVINPPPLPPENFLFPKRDLASQFYFPHPVTGVNSES